MLCFKNHRNKVGKLRLWVLVLLFVANFHSVQAQQWQDLYSYNTVDEFFIVDEKIYAVAENALFTYEINGQELEKISSVNGLSGGTISSAFYSESSKSLCIGYASGLLEIIDVFGEVETLRAIQDFNYTGEKSINSIAEYQNKLYLATSFGVVLYDLVRQEFSETYFLGENSSEIRINDIAFLNDQIFVASERGLHHAGLNDPFLVDYNNWEFIPLLNSKGIIKFNNRIFTYINNSLYEFQNNALQLFRNYPQTITGISSNEENMTVSTSSNLFVYDSIMNETFSYAVSSGDLQFAINQAIVMNNDLFIATNTLGILQSNITETPLDFEEIHPDGPISNSAFSISAKDDNLWMVYGGHTTAYNVRNNRAGISHYNGKVWNNIPYSDFGVNDLVNVTFDPNNVDKVYISSWGAGDANDLNNTGGILIMENGQKVDFWNHANSGLDKIPNTGSYTSTRIYGTAFDPFGNLWVANAWVPERVKKYSPSGQWTGFDMVPAITNTSRFGLNKLIIDNNNTLWIGTRGNGILIFNERLNRKMSFTTEVGNGSLPNEDVYAVKAGRNDRIWIGTPQGLYVYKNASKVFNQTSWETEQVALESNGQTGLLLGTQRINTIDMDGAGNMWFGTATQGVVHTNPNGTEILQEFNQENSPLPSNNIIKISVDENTGKVYMATDKGTLAYDSEVVGYGENLSEVYAYPNPSNRSSEFVTIASKTNQNLPYNTNIKIVDSAGNLVYETIVKEGVENFGGKVVWNKRNLAGRKVASGIYIVLISSNDNTETATTKIAIIK